MPQGVGPFHFLARIGLGAHPAIPYPVSCLGTPRDKPPGTDHVFLMAQAGIRLARHYFLYPNPWPKPRQLSRRWQGHAAFPTAVALGGVIECRSNWRLYVEEFAFALRALTALYAVCQDYLPATPFTPFEKKSPGGGRGTGTYNAPRRVSINFSTMPRQEA